MKSFYRALIVYYFLFPIECNITPSFISGGNKTQYTSFEKLVINKQNHIYSNDGH